MSILPNHTRIEKLREVMSTAEVDAFLFTSPSTIKYFSGYFYNFETGPNPFQLLPACLLVLPGENISLILADNESFALQGLDLPLTQIPYTSYSYQEPMDPASQFMKQLEMLIRQNHLTHACLGVEINSMPFTVGKTLQSGFPGIRLTDVSEDIIKLRLKKDSHEIGSIRKVAALCDVGQSAAMKHAQVGMTELELFNQVRREMEILVPGRLPLMADFVSGSRTASGGGGPTNKKIQFGDLVLCDLTPCLDGYWGDSCNTFVVGRASLEQQQCFALLKEVLEMTIQKIRPGLMAKEIDGLMRKYAGNFPHHGGHGVGISYHEEPRIVPYNTMILEPGMVIALEPGIYSKDFGVRLEHLVLITDMGCEVLTGFNHAFNLTN